MLIKERLNKLRKEMQIRNIDAYIVPTVDYHASEYIGDYFKVCEYLTGFTGESCTLVVTASEACLWVDGRYFIQAERELVDSTVKMMKMAEPCVLTIVEYLKALNPKTIGFDGKVLISTLVKSYINQLGSNLVDIKYEEDLVSKFWDDRPMMANEKAWLLDLKYCGEPSASKIIRVREQIRLNGANYHIISVLDDIAWLFNIRGNDIANNPVVQCFVIVGMNSIDMFIDEEKLNSKIISSFKNLNIVYHPYNNIYEYVTCFTANDAILLDPNKVNYSIYQNICSSSKKIEAANPTVLMKSIKNPVEIANCKNAHIKDGVAMAKFMFWLKTNIGKIPMSEISTADYLEQLRKEQEGFFELSFGTIAAYKDHGAMMHYSATKESNYDLKPEGFFLVDSGGQYLDGTTDITRTFILGPISNEEKIHYTTVVKSNIDLAMAKFLRGCRGTSLDILAREPLWKLDIDYKCGTGHGVGFVLNVHEAPNGFRWRVVADRNDSAILEPGMITTDEPGVYIEGKYGIRIENELLCYPLTLNEYGQFLAFETITLCPIDLDGILPELLTNEEIRFLNYYHSLVYDRLCHFLSSDERKWLRENTHAI